MSDNTVEGSGLQHSRSRSCIRWVGVSSSGFAVPEMQAEEWRDASGIRIFIYLNI